MCAQIPLQKPGKRVPHDGCKSRGSALFNWLDDLDRKAKSFPPADDWDKYPAFVFARYPRLRPKHVPHSEHKEFSQVIHNWKNRISDHPQASRCMAGLSYRRLRELAALVCDSALAIVHYRELQYEIKMLNKLMAEGPRHQRMVLRKREKVLKALTDLEEYCTRSVDPAFVDSIKIAVKQCREKLDPGAPFPFDRSVFPDTRVFSPLDEMMAKLYWFFRHGCKLDGQEAEVRVALIRNAFWTEYKIKRVPYRAEYKDFQSKGCPAVHQAVRRFSKTPSTIR